MEREPPSTPEGEPPREPVRPRRSRGQLPVPAVIALLLGALGVMQLTGVAGAGLRMVTQGIPLEEALRRVSIDPLAGGLAQVVGLGLAVLIGVRLAHGPDAGLRAALRVRPIPLRIAALAMIAGMGLQFVLVELTTVVSELLPAIAWSEDERRHLEELVRMDTPLRAISVPLAVVVIAPISEELVFRGLVQPAMRESLGTAGTIVMTAVLFGAFHVHPLAAIGAAVAGLVLGAVAIRARSVLAPMALHAGVNAVPLLLPASLVPIRGFNLAERAHLPLPVLLATTLVSAVALALLFRLTDEASSDDPRA